MKIKYWNWLLKILFSVIQMNTEIIHSFISSIFFKLIEWISKLFRNWKHSFVLSEWKTSSLKIIYYLLWKWNQTLQKYSCLEDFGCPLVAYTAKSSPVLVGVVSWGIGCAYDGYPGVYARVSAFVEWISQTIERNAY